MDGELGTRRNATVETVFKWVYVSFCGIFLLTPGVIFRRFLLESIESRTGRINETTVDCGLYSEVDCARLQMSTSC